MTTHEIDSINDIQSNLEAVSVLIKPSRFKKENEIRYVHEYSKLLSINYNNYKEKGENAFSECTPSNDNEERYICFHKETLSGINVGYKSADKLEIVRKYLHECGYDLLKIRINICDKLK